MSEDKDIRDLDVSDKEGEDIKGGRFADVPEPLPPGKKPIAKTPGVSDAQPTATGSPPAGTSPISTKDPKSPGRLPPK